LRYDQLQSHHTSVSLMVYEKPSFVSEKEVVNTCIDGYKPLIIRAIVHKTQRMSTFILIYISSPRDCFRSFISPFSKGINSTFIPDCKSYIAATWLGIVTTILLPDRCIFLVRGTASIQDSNISGNIYVLCET